MPTERIFRRHCYWIFETLLPNTQMSRLTAIKLSRQIQQDGSVRLIDINVASPENGILFTIRVRQAVLLLREF